MYCYSVTVLAGMAGFLGPGGPGKRSASVMPQFVTGYGWPRMAILRRSSLWHSSLRAVLQGPVPGPLYAPGCRIALYPDLYRFIRKVASLDLCTAIQGLAALDIRTKDQICSPYG